MGEEDPVEVEERLGAGQVRLDVWVEGNAVCHGAVTREGVGPSRSRSSRSKASEGGDGGVLYRASRSETQSVRESDLGSEVDSQARVNRSKERQGESYAHLTDPKSERARASAELGKVGRKVDRVWRISTPVEVPLRRDRSRRATLSSTRNVLLDQVYSRKESPITREQCSCLSDLPTFDDERRLSLSSLHHSFSTNCQDDSHPHLYLGHARKTRSQAHSSPPVDLCRSVLDLLLDVAPPPPRDPSRQSSYS